MIIVTGGAGFIGSNVIAQLNQQGYDDIVVVDDLTDGKKFVNLVDLTIRDYLDKDDFYALLQQGKIDSKTFDAVFHLGACSSTTEWDGRFMMQTNYACSKQLLSACLEARVPFIYASSAAVYGSGQRFVEAAENEKPLNVYGYSKYLFDQYVRRLLPDVTSPVIGLRYFNVYGPREQHKGGMASVAWHLHQQLLRDGVVKLFAGCDGYADGEQRRDFVYVEDVAKVNVWCLQQRPRSGIYNVGSGRSQPFNDVAHAVLNWHQQGTLEYIPFPEKLRGCYQSFTEADLSALRAAGYTETFMDVQQGVAAYLDWLQTQASD